MAKIARFHVQPTRMQKYAAIVVCVPCRKVLGSAIARMDTSGHLAATPVRDLGAKSVVVKESAYSKVVVRNVNVTRIMLVPPVLKGAPKTKMVLSAMVMGNVSSRITKPFADVNLGILVKIARGVFVPLLTLFSTQKLLVVYVNQAILVAVERSRKA